MSTEMVVHSNGAPLVQVAPEQRLALEPKSFEDGMRLAELIVESGMFGVKNRADAFIRISTGVALGLSAVQSLRGIYVISGKAGLSADLMMALCLQSPDCEYFRMVESTPRGATFAAKRRSDPKPTELSFTIDDAKTAGLTGNAMYSKYPAQMLRARCIAALARLVFPERCHGLYTPDELKTGELAKDEIPEAELVEPMPTREIAKAASEVVAAATKPDFLAIGAELEGKLALVETPSEIAALRSEYRPKFKGASKDIGERIKAMFDTATAQLQANAEPKADE